MKKNLSTLIKQKRHELGLNMTEFGELFNPPASQSVISRWEMQAGYPNSKRMFQLAKIINVPYEELVALTKTNFISEELEEIQTLFLENQTVFSFLEDESAKLTAESTLNAKYCKKLVYLEYISDMSISEIEMMFKAYRNSKIEKLVEKLKKK